MDIDLPLILTLAVLASGVVWGIDRVAWRPRRRAAMDARAAELTRQTPETAVENDEVWQNLAREPALQEYVGSFFPVLLVVLLLRSFVAEPFQIPSGSMIPTLLEGDFIVVNKFAYGLRLPVLGTKFVPVGEPERGDVMVFVPPHVDRYFIKRVIGLPGDRIRYARKRLFVNGELVEELPEGVLQSRGARIERFTASLGEITHPVYKNSASPARAAREWVVPEGHYFMMGDNRDLSDDSRYWGFASEQQIVGKAMFIWLHWPSWGAVPSLSRVGAIR